MAPINLNEQVGPSTEGIDLMVDSSSSFLSPEVVDGRATRAAFGMRRTDLEDYKSYKRAIATGRETTYRKRDAQEVKTQIKKTNIEIIKDFSTNLQRKATPMELTLVAELAKYDEDVDYRGVWEEQFAKQVLTRALDTNIAMNAELEDTEHAGQVDAQFNVIVARNQFIENIKEEIMGEIESKARFGPSRIGGFLATMLPVINTLAQGIGASKAGLSRGLSGLLFAEGQAFENQIQSLLNLDPEAQRTAILANVKALRKINDRFALDFLDAMQSQSRNERFLFNAFGMLDVADIGAIAAAGGRAALRGSRGLKRLPGAEEQKLLPPPQRLLTDQSKGAVEHKIEIPENQSGVGIFEEEGFPSQPGTAFSVDVEGNIIDRPTFESEFVPVGGMRVGKEFKLPRRDFQVTGTSFVTSKTYARTAADVAHKVNNKKPVEEVLEAGGKTQSAAVARVHSADKIMKDDETARGSTVSFAKFKAIYSHLPSFADVTQVTNSRVPKMGRALAEHWQNRRVVMENILSDENVIAQASVESLKFGVQVVKDRIRTVLNDIDRLDGTAEQVTDIKFADFDAGESKEALHMVEGYVVGLDGKAFTSAEEARNLMALRKVAIDRVEPVGDGFVAVIREPVTQRDLQGWLLKSLETKAPGGFINRYFSRLFSWNNSLDKFTRKQRGTAVSDQTKKAKGLMEMFDSLAALSGRSKVRLSAIFRENALYEGTVVKNGKTIDEHGRWHKDQFELEDAWSQMHGRAINEKESFAYWDFIALYDIDYAMRNATIYRGKLNAGIKQYGVEFKHTVNENQFNAVHLEGIRLDDIPRDSEEPFNVIVLKSDGGTNIYTQEEFRSSKEIQGNLERFKAEGYRILQVGNPPAKPFENATGFEDVFHYAVVKISQVDNLNTKQLDYNSGGHREYASKFFIKQPRTRKSNLTGNTHAEGDITFLGFQIEADAIRYLLDLNRMIKEYREAIENGDFTKFNTFIRESRLPFSQEKAVSFFLNDPEKGTKSILSYAEGDEFHVVSSGKATPKREGIVDEYETIHNPAFSIDKEFVGERGGLLRTLIESENELGQTVIKQDYAILKDPLKIQTGALSRLLRLETVERVKEATANQFVELLSRATGESLDTLKPRAVAVLHQDLSEKLKNVPFEQRQQLLDMQQAAIQFVGTPTPFAEKWNDMWNRFVNHAFEKKWTVPFLGTAERMSLREIGTTRDPTKFLRMIGFHSKLGMFNPVQLFVQSQTLVHILAFSPKHAVQSTGAAVLMRTLDLNTSKEILEGVAKKAKVFGWTRDDFVESMETLRSSGYKVIEGDTSYLDDFADPSFWRGKTSKVFNWGTVFFKEGDRIVRMAAWNAAYREWKDLNKFKKISLDDKQTILNRASDLANNMRRDSNASWQRGFAATPTQFWSYQARLMDAFMGPRFSSVDKMRAIAIYSGVYGIPITTIAAGPLGLYPWGDFLKEEVRSHGIDPNDGVVGALMNGLPQFAGKLMFGKDYAFSERMAPSGLPIIHEILSGERGFEAMLGASGSISVDIFKDLSPFFHAIWQTMSSDDEFPLVWEDFRAVLANISSLSNVLKMGAAYNTGMYITGNGIEVGPVDNIDSFVMGVFGINPQEYNDVFVMAEVLSSQKELKEEMSKNYVVELKRWVKALNDGNVEHAKTFQKRMAVYMKIGGIKPNEYGNLMRRAAQAVKSPMAIGVQRNYREHMQGKPFGSTVDIEEDLK